MGLLCTIRTLPSSSLKSFIITHSDLVLRAVCNSQNRLAHAASQAASVNSSNGATASIPENKYELFVRPDVQDILKKLTAIDPHKVLPNLTKLKQTREITLMTKEQLIQAEKAALERAEQLSQMPPVLPPRKECEKVMAVDSQLSGLSTSSIVFTDTTLGLPERERVMVVRTPDGALMSAPWEVRDRVLQVYYPRSGRRVKPAPMFSGIYLENLIKERRYKYLLDSACCQYEPDHPDFIKITHQVYEDCEARETYHALLSTRHYGPMVFYFVLQKRVTNLLKHLLHQNRPDDCIEVIKLYSIVWDLELASPPETYSIKVMTSFIQNFIEKEAITDVSLLREIKILSLRDSISSSHSEKISADEASNSDSESDSSSSGSESDGSSSESESDGSSTDGKSFR
ncbi:MRPS22 [Bugula neritina]|uniref:MRPS22 n=1 Tax=Bugula neritina TaxID=10212 RepID=A0A7J7JIT6_BUGNE|nr:MRPS22 [Bugula neritina]